MYRRLRRYTGRRSYRKPYSSYRKSYHSNRSYVKKFRGGAARGIKRVVQRQIETKEYTAGPNTSGANLLAPTNLDGFGAGHGAFSEVVSYFKPMDNIAQGTSRNGRIGDAVTIMSIEWRYVINYADYEQDHFYVMAFTAPYGFVPQYGNIFEAPDGNVDVRVAKPNSNITVLKRFKHVISPLNTATAQSSSTAGTPSVFRSGCVRLFFKGGRKFQYQYNNYQGSQLLVNRNRDIFIAVIAFGASRYQGGSTLTQYSVIQGQELSIKFKDA